METETKTYVEEMIEGIEEDLLEAQLDGRPERCASCEAGGLDADECDDASVAVRVRAHYAGWADPRGEHWHNLQDGTWLVPMCDACAAMSAEQEAEEARQDAEEAERLEEAERFYEEQIREYDRR